MAIRSRSLRQTPTWQKGHNGERLVAELLRRRGWYVIPSYDYSGEDGNKSPKLEGLKEGYPVPDLDVARSGARLWVEVKTKKTPTYTRITGRLEHGIPLRLYRSYKRVQEITGCEVWLFIYEEETGDVLCGKLDALDGVKRIYEGDKMDQSGMVFWPRDAFRVFEQLPQGRRCNSTSLFESGA